MMNSKRIPCPNCTQTFITEDAKEKHYKTEHAPIKFKYFFLFYNLITNDEFQKDSMS